MPRKPRLLVEESRPYDGGDRLVLHFHGSSEATKILASLFAGEVTQARVALEVGFRTPDGGDVRKMCELEVYDFERSSSGPRAIFKAELFIQGRRLETRPGMRQCTVVESGLGYMR